VLAFAGELPAFVARADHSPGLTGFGEERRRESIFDRRWLLPPGEWSSPCQIGSEEYAMTDQQTLQQISADGSDDRAVTVLIEPPPTDREVPSDGPLPSRSPWALVPCSATARLVATMVLTIAVAALLVTAFTFDVHSWWSYVALGTSLLAIFASVGLLWYCSARPIRIHRDGGVGANLMGSAAMILAISSATTVVVYLLPGIRGKGDVDNSWARLVAPAAGIAAAAAVAAGVAISGRSRSTADRAIPSLFGELGRQWETLNTEVTALCESAPKDGQDRPPQSPDTQVACATARAQRDFIGRELGRLPPLSEDTGPGPDIRWVTGTGYIELWTRLHDADEALFVVSSDDAVVGEGLHDEMRIKDSNIRNEDDFLTKLRRAVLVMGGGQYLTPTPPLPQLNEVDTTEQGKRLARATLRDVRSVVNQYRDGRREALVRGRNHLAAVGMLTGLTAYALLALAVLVQAPAKGIMAAAAFYLVGAVVGLFDQLRLSSRGRTPTEEDYGLERARLVYAPILSGLAAVGGVAITALLYATVSGSLIVYQPPPTPPAQASATPTTASAQVTNSQAQSGANVLTLPSPTLNEVFDLDSNQFGLVLAAVFGLTPGLLVSRLQGQADRIKADLQSTSAPETSASGAH